MGSKNSEEPDFVVPQKYHNTTILKLLKAFPDIDIEITWGNKTLLDFCRDLKDPNFGKCKAIEYSSEVYDDTSDYSTLFEYSSQVTPIPYSLKIEYVGIVNKTLLYQVKER